MRIGEKIGESKHSNTSLRVLADRGNGPEIEVSFQETGTLLGKTVTGMGTYVSCSRPDGTVCGDGSGVLYGPKGETVTWKGCGTGKSTGPGGATRYNACIYFRTNAPGFERLNQSMGLVTFDVGADGKGTSETWEWRIET